MMDDDQRNDGTPQDESSAVGGEGTADENSLAGKGWDILVGGEENAAEFGGDDPFDLNAEPDDSEADSVLMMSADMPPGESVPDEAYYDRGKGAKGAVPYEGEVSAPAGSAAYGVPDTNGVIELPPLGEEAPPPAASLDDLGPTPPSSMDAEGLKDMGPTTPDDLVTPEPLPYDESGEPTSPEGLVTDEPLPFEESEAPFGGSEEPFGEASPAAQPAAYSPLTEGEATGEEEPAPGGMAFAALPSAYSRPDDPFADSWKPADTGPELVADKDIQAKLVTQERVDALWDEINAVYAVAVNDVRGYFSSTESALADLKKARELLMAGYENFDNAEQLVMRVKARLRLEEKVRQWARTRGTWIAVYLILWLLLLSSLSIVTFQLQVAIIAQELVPEWMAATILPGLFGGLGGVVGALWVLITHISKKRDFDPIHTSWYITNPFLGFALGVITYLILLVSSSMMNTTTTISDIASNPTSPIIYALCVIVGFNQNVLWALVDRVIKAIIPPEEDKATVEESAVGQPDA